VLATANGICSLQIGEPSSLCDTDFGKLVR